MRITTIALLSLLMGAASAFFQMGWDAEMEARAATDHQPKPVSQQIITEEREQVLLKTCSINHVMQMDTDLCANFSTYVRNKADKAEAEFAVNKK